jgi:hypothetical protein
MRRARDLLAVVLAPAVVAGGVLLPLAVHWLAGRTVVWQDTTTQFAPQRWIVEEALRAFRLPLWNPFSGGGMPLFAEASHGVLHPVSVLTALLRTGHSADVLVGGYVACAGLGAALLARSLGASRAGAAAAGLIYGASGQLLSTIAYLNLLAGAASLPWCLAGLRGVAAEARPSRLAGGALGTALLALSGDPQALMVAGALALVLAWEAGGWRGAARATAAGMIGLLVAGVQLVPSAMNIEQTNRAASAWRESTLVWSLAPWRLPELLLPGLFRGAEPLRDPVFAALAGAGRWPEHNPPCPFFASVFVGVVPMALAAAAVRDGRRARVLLALAVTCLWVSFGPTLGADAILRYVPIWRAFRYSEKLLVPFALLLAALAGLGLDAVAEKRVRGSWVLGAAGALGVCAAALAFVGAASIWPPAAALAWARAVAGSWHVLGAVLLLAAWLLVRGRLGRVGAPAGLAALAWGTVVAAAPAALHPGDPADRLRAPGPRLYAAPPGPRVVSFGQTFLSAAPGIDRHDEVGRVQAALAYPAYNVRLRIDSLTTYASMTPLRLATMGGVFGELWPVAARRYGVTHVVTSPPVTGPQREAFALATMGGTRVGSAPLGYEIWSVPHREWASFATQVHVAEDPDQAIAITFDRFRDPGAVVVESLFAHGAASGRVLALERGLESLRVEAESEGKGTLVVADAWWPGWEATIDGRPVTIHRADGLVRAVRWPAGRHVLEMHYRPPEIRRGLVVSALGVALLAAGVVLLRRRSRPAPA